MKKLFTIFLLFYSLLGRGQTSGWTFASNAEYGAQGINTGRGMIFTGNVGLNGIGSGTSGLQYFISTPGVTMVYSNSTLHGSSFVSSAHLAYWAGNNTDGEGGLPAMANAATLTQIAFDARGLPFNNIILTQGSYIQVGSDDVSGQFWVKQGSSSDTIFYAGWRKYGIAAGGFTGSDTVFTPTIAYSLPAGYHVLQMFGGVSVGFLRSDGTVWTWGAAGTLGYLGRAVSGSNYATPMQVTYPVTITQVVGGAAPGVLALGSDGHLYGFTNYSGYMGNAANTAYNTPVDLATNITSYILNGTTRTGFNMIAANSVSFHVIPNDGSLYGWGDGGMSCIGDGSHPNLLSPGGTSGPGFIDPSAILVYPITHPVRVTNRNDFVFIATGVNFAFITIAITADGQIHFCGRNKGGVIPNGVVECFADGGDIGSFYPDFADVADLTPMNPTGITSPIPQTWIGCVTGSSTANCHTCGPTTGLTANAGSYGTITGSFLVLNGTGSASSGGGYVTYYHWTVSGPGSPIISQQASGKPTLSNLVAGTYTVMLKVKDNGFDSTTASSSIVVNTGCPCIIKSQSTVYEKSTALPGLFALLLLGKEPDELQG